MADNTGQHVWRFKFSLRIKVTSVQNWRLRKPINAIYWILSKIKINDTIIKMFIEIMKTSIFRCPTKHFIPPQVHAKYPVRKLPQFCGAQKWFNEFFGVNDERNQDCWGMMVGYFWGNMSMVIFSSQNAPITAYWQSLPGIIRFIEGPNVSYIYLSSMQLVKHGIRDRLTCFSSIKH